MNHRVIAFILLFLFINLNFFHRISIYDENITKNVAWCCLPKPNPRAKLKPEVIRKSTLLNSTNCITNALKDTLCYQKIAPGITYFEIYFPVYPLKVYMMIVDLSIKHNVIETFQAGNTVGETEFMTKGHKYTSSSSRAIGSINGNFWIVPGQGFDDSLLKVPHSGSIRNGVMITDPNNWNRNHGEIGFVMLDNHNTIWIDDVKFTARVTAENKEEFFIDKINRIHKTKNDLLLFNQYIGTHTPSNIDVTEIFIKPILKSKWTINKPVVCEITRIRKNNGMNKIDENEAVLSGRGTSKEFLNKLKDGEKVKLLFDIFLENNKKRPLIQQMICGNALVLKDGRLTDRNNNEKYNSKLYPRSGIGTSKDGKTLYMMVIDKNKESIGSTTATMSKLLKSAGAYYVANMDGGGSAQMMLNGNIVNSPSDGKERAVANGWRVFSTFPEDTVVTKIDFADYKIRIPVNTLYKPKFWSYNKHGVVCSTDLKGVTIKCDKSLGKVINNQMILASCPQKGEIIAEYKGVQCRKTIEIYSTSN